eukprot:1161895-Pelagomonas_calceolata.AAC.4
MAYTLCILKCGALEPATIKEKCKTFDYSISYPIGMPGPVTHFEKKVRIWNQQAQLLHTALVWQWSA